MELRLAQLDGTNRAAFESLLPDTWDQELEPGFARTLIRWRFHERPPGNAAWLAFDGERCVAMLDSFLRPYLLDGRRILVRETCDWFCLPQYRPLGLGLRLMREIMAGPEPSLSIGGTEATLAMLPRLRWTPLPEVQKYVLPVRVRSLAGSLLRRKWPEREALARAIPGFLPLRPLHRAPPPPGVARVSEWRPGTPAPLPLPQRGGLVQLLEQADLDWIARTPPDFARPLGLAFLLDGRPVGFSLSQLEPVASGFDGTIVHLQIAHDAQPVADWIVAETAHRLAARGAGIIRCGASGPEKVAALRRAGFVARQGLPSYWWPGTGAPAPAALDAGYLRANDAMPFFSLRGRRLGGRGRPPARSAA
ncbi:hypothetical protein [Caldovatus aquaticus]|uniref:N-acetyltransferase domain-containing protein n=1 Tax=Caldovatus aquaticus TaxID=2865671 RepID=A0ABS7F145_9PROT|nr:hypothetical protein [Caldovatus aquaticus]MBW8268687.1 hypothetical protein [Caldovatus aquaticus]